MDVPLTEAGIAEARNAGTLCKEARLNFDVVHCSVQRRAILTAQLALDEMDQLWIPMRKHWRLNERHYGGLTGLNKQETAEKHGAEQVHLWRRSYDTPPPPFEGEGNPSHDRRYANLPRELRPNTECLADVVVRMMPYWYDFIVPDLNAGKNVLIAAHGNSLRALCKHLDQISDAEIPSLEIPTGQPLLYELRDDLTVAMRRYLSE